MIVDFNAAGALFDKEPDLCIIGAGALGLLIASRYLENSGSRVLVIESGDTVGLPDPVASEVLNTGDVESAVEGSFNRGLGGTTNSWGGQALPFSTIDFENRSWVENSGWPISAIDIDRYYELVAEAINVDYLSFSSNIWSSKNKREFSKLADHGLTSEFSKWCPETNFWRLYGEAITSSAHIQCLVNATVAEVVVNQERSRVESVKVQAGRGKQELVQPKIVILAAGGIENIRIMLHSGSLIGTNDIKYYPALGRYYQDHIGYYGARLIPKDWAKFRDMFATKMCRGKKCVPKLTLSEAVQRNKFCLNVTGNIAVEVSNESPLQDFKRLYKALRFYDGRESLFAPLYSILKNLPEAAMAAYMFFVKQQIYLPKKADYFLIANSESAPMPSSRVTLSEEIDSFGMNKAQVHWLVDAQSAASIRVYYESVKSALESLGVAEVIVDKRLLQHDRSWVRKAYTLYHHMGGTRMGDRIEDSVVDLNCKVHGVENLFIAGCSVFPTGSSSNPTYTALALGLRLVEHIETKV